MEPITIGKFIAQIRKELIETMPSDNFDNVPLFFVEEVEIELSVIVTNTKEVGGKVGIQVVELGALINRETEHLHKVVIKMTPLITKDELKNMLDADTKKTARLSRKALLKGDEMSD